MSSIAFTCGDVNGIGPEIVIKTFNSIRTISNITLIFVCPKNIFKKTNHQIPLRHNYIITKQIPQNLAKNKIIIYDIGNVKQNIGKPTISSGKKSYESIIKSCELAENKIVDGIVTAPISKEAFVKAGINFPGHTELFGDYFNVPNFRMMFISPKMKAALQTIHIPIKNVSKSLTTKKISDTVSIIKESLQKDFNIRNPKIALLGLNPHAGEAGNIGKEEIDIISKSIELNTPIAFGPFVPDAFFGKKEFKKYDCTIGMYHDQVLIPFKFMSFDNGVNFTAGLPIVRTSPDHGTAFDIAGMGKANSNSMLSAYKLADKIIKNRNSH